MLTYFLLIIEEEGERRKFRAIYDSYRYRMLYIAKGILKDQGLAEDAVQESFLYLALNISSVNDEVESPKTRNYVYLITKHKAIDIVRKRKREIYMSEAELNQIGTGYEHIEKVVIENQEYREILMAIYALPEKYRESLELHLVYGLTIKKTASLLNEKIETIKKRIQRGKETLRKNLNGRNRTAN